MCPETASHSATNLLICMILCLSISAIMAAMWRYLNQQSLLVSIGSRRFSVLEAGLYGFVPSFCWFLSQMS